MAGVSWDGRDDMGGVSMNGAWNGFEAILTRHKQWCPNQWPDDRLNVGLLRCESEAVWLLPAKVGVVNLKGAKLRLRIVTAHHLAALDWQAIHGWASLIHRRGKRISAPL